MPTPRDATEQIILQKPDGTQVWLGEWSAVHEALFLAINALDMPYGPKPQAPPPDRCRFYVTEFCELFRQDDLGQAGPAGRCFSRTVAEDIVVPDGSTCVFRNPEIASGVTITVLGSGEIYVL